MKLCGVVETDSRPQDSRILIFEADRDLCELLRTVLEWHHFAVSVVHRGADAVQALLREDFAAVVCSTTLPGLPVEVFYRALERIRPDLCGRLIFLSASEEGEQDLGPLAGCGFPLVQKPVVTTELFEAIARVREPVALAS